MQSTRLMPHCCIAQTCLRRMKTCFEQADKLFIGAHVRQLRLRALRLLPSLWEHAIVTFRKYSAFFQPHELEALNAAYDAAWERLRTKTMNGPEAANLKSRLAQVILASACSGERDAKRLEHNALRALLGHRNNKQLQAERC